MSELGHALMAVGLALLLVPIAGMAGVLGYFLLGMGLVVAGAMLSFSGDESAELERVNCSDCGSPNDSDADACDYCGEPL